MRRHEDKEREKQSAGADANSGAAHKRIRPSGGYRKLRSFRVTTVIYDGTVSFCDRFVDRRSRTHDQMVQAARSGRQNIAEGSRAAATSSQTELRLVNVARASLDELLLDYEDYLRQHNCPQWSKDAPEAIAVREVGRSLSSPSDPSDLSDRSDPTDDSAPYRQWLTNNDPAFVANAIICLIHQANYLLDQQVRALERQFVEGGGYSEQLATARLRERARQAQPNKSDSTDSHDGGPFPACPVCEGAMVLRTARQGSRVGSQFWGCERFPECKGTRAV